MVRLSFKPLTVKKKHVRKAITLPVCFLDNTEALDMRVLTWSLITHLLKMNYL